MELNKWYKCDDETQFVFKTGQDGGPGFLNGKWVESLFCTYPSNWILIKKPDKEEKLIRLLKKEAEKRYKTAKTIKSAHTGIIYNCYLNNAYVNYFGALDNNGVGYLFFEGKWAGIDTYFEDEASTTKIKSPENIIWTCYELGSKKVGFLIREPKFNPDRRYICITPGFWTQNFVCFDSYKKRPATLFETKWYEACEQADEYFNLPELWEEAKKRYPIGTEFIIPHLQDIVRKVKSHDEHEDMFIYNGRLHINLLQEEDSDSDCDSASVYFDGKWAKVVSKKEEKEHPLITEAKKRYPVGTKYYPVHVDNGNIEKDARFYVSEDQKFVLCDENVYLENPDGEVYNTERNGVSYSQTIFYNGKWAKILTESATDSKPSKEYYTRVWHSGTKTIGYRDEQDYFVSLEDYSREGGVSKGSYYGYCGSLEDFFQYPSLQFEIDYYKTHGVLQTMNDFKTDDYVVLVQTCNGESEVWGRNMRPGMTFKLSRNSNNYDFGFYAGKTFGSNGWSVTVPKDSKNIPLISHLLLRKATESEIKKYQETEENSPKETPTTPITSFGDWKIGDKVLCVKQGGNDTEHPLWKKSYDVHDILTITGFTESTAKKSSKQPQTYICAVCEGGYVIYIEQYSELFQKCPEVKESIEKMDNQFKVGDKVILSEHGLKEWGNQSRGNVGIIEGILNQDSCPIVVRWDTNNSNGYYPKNLTLVPQDTTPFQPLPQNPNLKKMYKVGDMINIHGITFEFCTTLYLGFRGDLLHTEENADNFYRMLGLKRKDFPDNGIMPIFPNEKDLSEHIDFLLSCKPLCSFEDVDKLENPEVRYKEGDNITIHGVHFYIDKDISGYYLNFSQGLFHSYENAEKFLGMFGLKRERWCVMPTFETLQEISKWIETLKATTPLYDFYSDGIISIKEPGKEKQEIIVKLTESFLPLQTESLLPDPIEFINVERTKYFPQVEEIKY